ncbi:unnamed protein product [Euphydryas editha]|uniref:Secreted protein n=1 Tax=Euphydryas editha TaxID=104508 RepID=A0AAU9V749_EUPED|nr:unnamed protein product [Euphydryas editha]
MFSKMREFIRITLVCACAFLLVHDVRSEEDASSEVAVESEVARTEDQNERKETKTFIPVSKIIINRSLGRLRRCECRISGFVSPNQSTIVVRCSMKGVEKGVALKRQLVAFVPRPEESFVKTIENFEVQGIVCH